MKKTTLILYAIICFFIIANHAQATSGLFWQEHFVDSFNGAHSVCTGDIDCDGDLDIVAAASYQDTISWWENTDGEGISWIEHVVDNSFYDARLVYVADVDNDGDLDILGAAAGSDDITWWENTNGEGTIWTEHIIDGSFDAAHSVYAIDIDGDEDVDVIGAAYNADTISWWENTDGKGTSWTAHTLTSSLDGASSVYAADVDNDNDIDLISAAYSDDYILWWENEDGLGTSWQSHILSNDFNGALCVAAADMDADGDIDIIGAARTGDDIAWWENMNGNGTSWTVHYVDNSFDGAYSVCAADVDSDGDLDLLASANYADDIVWYENENGFGTVWLKHFVDSNFDGAFSAHAADVDGDGDMDILGAAGNADIISWWENREGVVGIVTSFSTGEPVYSVTVTADGSKTEYTDTLGYYFLAPLSPDTHEIVFSKTGYQTLTIPDVAVAKGEDTELNIEINLEGLLNIATADLAAAEVGIEYSDRVRISGGTQPYEYSIASSGLPPGLAIDIDDGTISGIPTAIGSFTFVVGVTDDDEVYAEREFTIPVTQPLTIATASPLPRATRFKAYSQSIEATGGASPYTFTKTGGSLPTGLSLSSDGLLSGSTSSTGSFDFTIAVTDDADRLTEKAFHLEVDAPLAIATTVLNDGIVGTAFDQTLSASGGYGDYIWRVYAGQLPPGLFLDSLNGTISGTPTTPTYNTIVLSVSDENGRTSYKDLPIQVCDPPQILTSALPDALIDESFSEAIRIDGGVGPYHFSYVGQLPAGLGLNASTGIISGTPTQAGLTNVSITVNDNSYPVNQSHTKTLSIRVTGDLTITTSAVLPNVKKDVAISSVVLTAGGGPSPNTWQLTGGYLPDGISLDAATGTLNGTPVDRGDFLFTIQVTDDNNDSAEKEFFWHVSADLTITTGAVADGAKDDPYSFMLEAQGGIKPYAWSLVNGTLPSGLALNPATGAIYGTPTARANYEFTVRVTDSDAPAQTAEKAFIMDVVDELIVFTEVLPNGRIDAAYTATVSAKLGVPPYAWHLESGTLPPGITLESSPTVATLEGTPSLAGNYGFTLEVSDSDTPTAYDTKPYTVEIYNDVILETDALPCAVRNVDYSESIVASGGKIPYTFEMIAGNLPLGLALNSTSGLISGKTAEVGGFSSTFTIRATDAGNPSDNAEKELVVYVIDALAIETDSLQGALQKADFEADLEGSGGVSPYSWSISSGHLSDGLSLDSSTGRISGSPLECGTFNFTIRLTDAAPVPNTTTHAYSLNVTCCNDYDISGSISGAAGAAITLSGDADDDTIVDGSGDFIFQHLENGTYTLTPALTYFTFDPASKAIIVNNRDATGVAFVLIPDDTDNDFLPDYIEAQSCTKINDADTDNDGILDGDEDENQNGAVDADETDPCDADTDGDGIQDGTERGYTLADVGADTDKDIFIPDEDPQSITDPLSNDTDNDGLKDGKEDKNINGRLDEGETDPNVFSPRAMSFLPLLLE